MSMVILLAIILMLSVIAKSVNKHNLVDRTIDLFEDPNSRCNRCGRYVKLGSGLWSNRLRDYDSIEVRKSKGAKYPEGNFICGDCLNKESKK